jgi:hypothetical protein
LGKGNLQAIRPGHRRRPSTLQPRAPSVRFSPVACRYRLGEHGTLLREDFASCAARSFRKLNPCTPFAANWHVDVVAAKLAAVRAGRIRRLIVSLPPRHLKSL